MTTDRLVTGRTWTDVCSVNTLVIGSGAAALNAAVTLHDLGQRDLAIVTEAWGGGTSANAGSDKQTYYKLSLAGPEPDSPRLLAADLVAGGSMHGDIALCEAQHSAQAFYHLVQLGVPFPHDRYGAFPGYQTDHDQRGRATSAGPLTSRLMVTVLSRAAQERRIPVFEPFQVVALLTDGAPGAPRIAGAAALDLQACAEGSPRVLLFNARNVILGTGGPGGLYLDSVYPAEQTGSIGIAFRAGAVGQNLTESQFGLSSIGVRWNVSGSYQQVVPRYVSTDEDGLDAHEFLNDAFPDAGTLGTAIFRKGYQWPFDPRRVRGHASSLIDLLVYRERVARGRRVFLDFTGNFEGGGAVAPFSLDALHDEARAYLERCGATGATPIARLARMNQPAIDFYGGRGIALGREPLEIAVCAQHNNGGFRGSIWWESNVRGLFPVGEVCGTHGVTRPGGSALNAGQVGSARAALFIARRRAGRPLPEAAFAREAGAAVLEKWELAEAMLGRGKRRGLSPEACLAEVKKRMSACGAVVRRPAEAGAEKARARELWLRARREMRVPSARGLAHGFKAIDLALTHAVYLEAIDEYLARGGKSRGSYLVPDAAGDPPHPLLGERWAYALAGAGDFVSTHILEVRLDGRGRFIKEWVPVRPVPRSGGWFESVWADYRDGRIVVDNPVVADDPVVADTPVVAEEE